MKRITLVLAFLGSVVMSYGIQAATTTLHKAIPYIIGLSTNARLDLSSAGQSNGSNSSTDTGSTTDSGTTPDGATSSTDGSETGDGSSPTTPTDTGGSSAPAGDSPSDDVSSDTPSDEGNSTDASNDSGNDSGDNGGDSSNSDNGNCNCDSTPRTTYVFKLNNEEFAATFPNSPGLEPVACAGFNLFFSPGDVFSLLVAAPRESGDENISGLLSNWRDLLERRYPDSSVAQVTRSAATHANGQVSIDSVFYIVEQKKFVRARIILSSQNSYVLSTTFTHPNSEQSNVFFEGFTVAPQK